MGLRLHIDGDWDAADVAAFYRCLDELHNYLALCLEYENLSADRIYAFGFKRGPTDARFRLLVKQIKYASPGFTDLAGLAAAMKEIRELIQFLITHWSERTDRKLSRQKNKLEIAKLRLELLERAYSIESQYGSRMPFDAEKYFGIKSNDLPDIDPLIDAVINDRLVGIENDSKEPE